MKEPDYQPDQVPDDPAAAPRPDDRVAFGARAAALAGQFIGVSAASGVAVDALVHTAVCSSSIISPTLG